MSFFRHRPSEASSPASEDPISIPAANVIIPPSTLKLDKINPHANWFNRPASLIQPKDDYMGERPHIDTVANLTRLVEVCRGSYEGLERMRYVTDCQKYLENEEADYLYLPPADERSSRQSPRKAEFTNADGHNNTLSWYPSYKPHTTSRLGQCNGPIIPFHGYWTGPSTWRLELFIKAYLYTQNLPCSRLWIWLDCDKDPNAISRMLEQDAEFARFLPMVERGDIVLKAWNFPSRIPLPPGDNTDGKGYYSTPGKMNLAGEVAVADGLMRDAEGQEWLVLTDKQKTFLPVAISDAVRFVVIHLHGGVYLDVDVVLLRDMRPLVIGEAHSFAERWGAHASPGDYNTAIMSLTANSSLSSYFVRGAVRMGMNFHPRVLGLMAVKDGQNHEFDMLETALFDPLWTEFDHDRLGPCNTPCLRDYTMVFKGSRDAFPNDDEWDGYSGPGSDMTLQIGNKESAKIGRRAALRIPKPGKQIGTVKTFDERALANAVYRIEEDYYPPGNRTLENFFKGSWSYHVHNQWLRHPEPSSWLNVIQRAHDDYFAATRTNVYGESWIGPKIANYELSWEFY
ncbi:MAG: hypothetical protein M1818_003313 [Claussenomyces sp. TS43310]|nr:MAG: hypothetical protein M1818_003313 [Claussenomyces sp. TS43310]